MTLEYLEIQEMAMKERQPMTATQMLDELDVRTTPDGRKRIFSMKFCTKEGKLHYFPQVYITGVNNMDMKAARYRGVQPCCTQGNPEGHLFPVKITNIIELDGHPIDWGNGYTEDPPQPSSQQALPPASPIVKS